MLQILCCITLFSFHSKEICCPMIMPWQITRISCRHCSDKHNQVSSTNSFEEALTSNRKYVSESLQRTPLSWFRNKTIEIQFKNLHSIS